MANPIPQVGRVSDLTRLIEELVEVAPEVQKLSQEHELLRSRWDDPGALSDRLKELGRKPQVA